jgi:hypothetical protein
MCTVSWTHQDGGYHLLCNRDEKRTRGVASAPCVKRVAGTRYIAPIDKDFGGTWIAVNEWGLAICLLNGGGAGSGSVSRGLLIPEMIWARSADDACFLLGRQNLTFFAPFTTIVLEPDHSATVLTWDGARLEINPDADSLSPLVSSSFDTERVRQRRRAEFSRRIGVRLADPAHLYNFHSSHGSGPDAYSPCMHRQDAETVSFSWIVVTPQEIRFTYSAAAPCQSAPCEQEILPRAA